MRADPDTGDDDTRRATPVVIILAWACLVAVPVCLPAGAADPNKPADTLHGRIRLGYDNFFISGDKGRFREDQGMRNGNTGGLDDFYLRSADPNGYEWTVRGRAIHDYDCRLSARLEKKNDHYLLLDFTSFRRYFDGSNEPWNAPAAGLAERRDDGLFTDHRNYTIELGIVPKNDTHFVFGWHRFVKDGREVLLRGANAISAGGNTFSGVPVVANRRGITDTLYMEASRTFFKKYNFRFRQEFEQYRENRRLDTSSYDITGSVDKSDIVDDDPGYTNWRTLLMFDSFLDEETYVTANYMYNYLNSDSTRNIIGYHEHTTTSGGNSRKTNAATFGYRRDNIMAVDGLSLIAGARIEDSTTKSHMIGTSKYYNFLTRSYTGPKPRIVESSLHEAPVREMLRLVYKGIERTTLSFDADLEQRTMRWRERDRHGGVFSDPDLSRKTDIDITNQRYTIKAVHRFSRRAKSTVRFTISDNERSYTDLLDESAFYPGYLDSYRITSREFHVSGDWRLDNNTGLTLLYEFLQEGIDTSLGGKTQNMEIHRGAGSLSCSPAQNLFVVGTFMLENYDLDTPAIGVAANHAQGARPFDFRGSSYSLLLDGTYVFNDRTSCTFGFQHTEALGTVDFAGDYSYNSVALMLQHKCSANKTIGIGYRFMSFNDHAGGFDDYRAHGLTATCTFTF